MTRRAKYQQLEEMTLAMAQSTLSTALNQTGLSRSRIADRLGIDRAFITKALRGNYSMTIKTMARLAGACGYELRFELVKIPGEWVLRDDAEYLGKPGSR